MTIGSGLAVLGIWGAVALLGFGLSGKAVVILLIIGPCALVATGFIALTSIK